MQQIVSKVRLFDDNRKSYVKTNYIPWKFSEYRKVSLHYERMLLAVRHLSPIISEFKIQYSRKKIFRLSKGMQSANDDYHFDSRSNENEEIYQNRFF